MTPPAWYTSGMSFETATPADARREAARDAVVLDACRPVETTSFESDEEAGTPVFFPRPAITPTVDVAPYEPTGE